MWSGAPRLAGVPTGRLTTAAESKFLTGLFSKVSIVVDSCCSNDDKSQRCQRRRRVRGGIPGALATNRIAESLYSIETFHQSRRCRLTGRVAILLWIVQYGPSRCNRSLRGRNNCIEVLPHRFLAASRSKVSSDPIADFPRRCVATKS